MSGISTHILDTSTGKPAAGVQVRLFEKEREIGSGVTNADGRCQLISEGVASETYRLVFETGSYFHDGFYPEVSISFIVRDTSENYHVPILISPFGFTTYRGS